MASIDTDGSGTIDYTGKIKVKYMDLVVFLRIFGFCVG
jgi:hypothetical protein